MEFLSLSMNTETNSRLLLPYSLNIHMDVLCVERYLDYIIAGIGNTLFVYKSESLETSIPIFLNERIHKFYVGENYILVKGGKHLAIVNLEKVGEKVNCHCITEIQCSDWIQDVIKLSGTLIGLTTAHNLFEIWDLKSGEKTDVKFCNEKCILYSCKIFGSPSENIIIFSGTVFGEIIIWNPFTAGARNILKRFEAHIGAVFSIEINIKEKILLSTSDDRSLKVWSIDTSDSLVHTQAWRSANIKLMHTLFGHTARVWRSLIISDFYVTVGEDSQMIVWRCDGTVLKKLLMHQASGIRGLCFSEETSEIITGGGDGGINVIAWNSFISECQSAEVGKIINIEKNFSTRVCYVRCGFVYTTNRACILVNDAKQKFLYQSDDFFSYCILEVSPLGDFAILGSIKGHLVVIDIESKLIVTEGQYVSGRVYSIHWLNDHIITCGSNGLINLWKLSNNILTSSKTFVLPQCKERWTTCAMIYNCKIVVGDRMGNIHVFDIEGGDKPIQTFYRIHSYLGVTDIIKDNNNVLTIGRDGTLKTFSENLIHLSTNKLPMDWPWKIINYKSDKLILGFHSVFFIVWSIKLRAIIVTKECGGGHRSCHCVLDGDQLKFIYVREKKVFNIDIPLVGITRLRNGFHNKEINTLQIVQTEPPVIITGSEDTTVRISSLHHSDIEALHVLKTHLSSVRTLAVSSFNDSELLVVSAGGKAQILLWKFNIKYMECQELINHRLKNEVRNWKCKTPMMDPETRFMSIDIANNENEFLIVVGCSDSRIRIFSFNDSFNLLFEIVYTHCILKVSIFKMNGTIYIMSLGTDGKVVFWRFLPENVSAIKCGYDRLHQSGINSFALANVECGKLILATGGDDNKIVVSVVEILNNEVEISQIWSNSNAHSCQITGVKIVKNHLITASIDQRITLWKWSYDSCKFDIQYEDQRLTSVPDVQGLEVKLCSDNAILAIVYGKGIEVIKIGCR